jgi:hypothetical protein
MARQVGGVAAAVGDAVAAGVADAPTDGVIGVSATRDGSADAGLGETPSGDAQAASARATTIPRDQRCTR